MSIKRLVPLNTVSLTADPSNAVAGDIYYNSGSSQLRYFNGTSWVILAGSVNALVDAKSIYQDVRNQSGTNMALATPVYVSGGIGASNKILISTASNASEASSSKTMGITTSAISNNSNGQVISEGLLEGIDTTGASDGDPVWLGVDGAKIYGLLNKPSAPAHLVFLGIVIRGGSANTGSMYVKIQNGFELQEIHNVELSSLINGNVLAYDSTTSTWKNTNTLQSTASTIPLVLKGSESQTANIFEVQRSVSSVNFAVGDLEIFGYRRMTLFSAGSSATVLIVRGAASQTADLQVWANSSGTALGAVTSSGRIWATSMTVAANGGVTTGSQFGVAVSSASSIGAVIRGASSQTANLIEWQNSSGTTLGYINSEGSIYSANRLVSPGDFEARGNSFHGSPSFSGATVNITTRATTQIGAIIRGVASQTANLQEWQNSSGTVMARVASDGAFYTGGLSAYSNGNVSIGNVLSASYLQSVYTLNVASYASGPASQVPLTVNGVTGQTGNLTEWKDVSGNVLAKVESSGQSAFKSTTLTASSSSGSALTLVAASGQTAPLLTTAGGAQISSGGNYFIAPGINATYVLSVTSGGTTVVPFTVTGIASQTANLQEWKNSGGTTLAAVSSNGSITGGSYNGVIIGLNYPGIVLDTSVTDNTQVWLRNLSGSSKSGRFVGIKARNSYADAVAGDDLVTLAGQQYSSGTAQDSGKILISNDDSTPTSTSYPSRITFHTTSVGSTTLTERMRISNSGNVLLNGFTSSTVGLTVKAAASQTANLQEWQISNGTVKTSISSDGTFGTTGNIYANRYYYSTNGTAAGTSVAFIDGSGGGGLSIRNIDLLTPNAGFDNITPLTVSGNVNQTADLQRWNNGAGTTVAKVDKDGNITASVLIVSGDFTVNGTTTNINTTNLIVEDKNITIADVATPTDTTANGAGITIKGATDKTFNWVQSTGRFTSSEPIQSPGLVVSTPTNTTNAGVFYNSAGTIVFNVDTSLNQINIGGGLSGVANNFASAWGYDSAMNAGFITFQTGALGGDSFAIRRTNHVASGDYTVSALGNLRFSTASGKNFNFNNGNVGISTTTIGTNNKLIVNPYSTVDNLATVQINTSAATNKGLVIQGYNSQTANLTEWQNSAGVVTAYIGNSVSYFGSVLTVSNDIKATYGIHGGGLTTAVSAMGTQSWSTTMVGMVVRGTVSQTADLQQWQNSDGTALAKINNYGDVTAAGLFTTGGVRGGTLTSFGAQHSFATATGATTTPSVAIRAIASQTANLTEWQDSTGNILTLIPSGGGMVIGRSNALGAAAVTIQSVTPISLYSTDNTSALHSRSIFMRGNSTGNVMALTSKGDTSNGVGALVITNGGFSAEVIGFGYNGNIYSNIQSASTVGLTIKGAASQSANLQEWQDSTGSIKVYVNQNGVLGTNAGTYFAGGGTYVTQIISSTATTIPLLAKGHPSQTANLQEWQDSSGNVLSSIGSTGNINLGAGKLISFSNGTVQKISLGYGGSYSIGVDDYTTVITADNNASNGRVGIRPHNATYATSYVSPIELYVNGQIKQNLTVASVVGHIIKAASAQTANLTEWQNSAGTVLASVSPEGDAKFRLVYVGTTVNYGAMLNVNALSAGNVGIIVQGVSSQTGDLQQWRNSSGTVLAKVDANGNFSAISKSFDITHPTKENMRLRYASLEGNEHGVYVRGITKDKVIELPDYWLNLVDENSITVHLTPIGKPSRVYVKKIEDNKVYLGGRLKEAAYIIYAERKDIDKLIVEY